MPSVGRRAGDLRTPGGGELLGASFATLQAADPAEGGCGGVLPVVHLIDNLAGCDIDNELAELERVAGAGETMDCHA
jgi:hypothetical protein